MAPADFCSADGPVITQNRMELNWSFFIGSLMSSLSQGWMLGLYIMDLDTGWLLRALRH